MEIDEGEFWLKEDLDIKCWEGTHMYWVMTLGVPLVIIWVATPLVVGIIFLKRN